MSGLIKGRLYENKDGRIIRLLAFLGDTSDVYVVDCRTRKMTYEDVETLRSYTEIDEDVMLAKTVGHVPHISTLSKVQQKVCRDRYNLIAPLLFDIELPETNDKINAIAKQYKITPRSIRKYLSTYCAYGRIETLLPHNKDFKYDCKPKFRFIPYSDALDQEPNYSVLIQDKLKVAVGDRAVYIHLLFDTFSRKILSHSVTLDSEDFGSIKELFDRCISNQSIISNRINITVKKHTYNSNLRNLSCIGVDIRFSYVSKSSVKGIERIIEIINKTSKGLTDLETIDKEVNKVINTYNNETECWGLSHNQVYSDILHIFKDSAVRISKEEINKAFTATTYKEFFGD